MARQDDIMEADGLGGDNEVVEIYRKIHVGTVDMHAEGTVPFEAAVLLTLGERLSHPDASVVHVVQGAMHDRYEATWKGHSVVVKLGDLASEDMV